MPTRFYIGTIADSAGDSRGGRLTKKERKRTIAHALLADEKFQYVARHVAHYLQPCAGWFPVSLRISSLPRLASFARWCTDSMASATRWTLKRRRAVQVGKRTLPPPSRGRRRSFASSPLVCACVCGSILGVHRCILEVGAGVLAVRSPRDHTLTAAVRQARLADR